MCLTYEECIARWNLQEEQRKRKEAQEWAAKPNVVASLPLAVAPNNTAGLQRQAERLASMILRKMPTAVPASVPVATPQVPATAAKASSKRKRRNPLFCNKFNTAAGCNGKETVKGCEWPDGSIFRHACSYKLDGKFCNDRGHNIFACPLRK